jgi:hypothetical protein
LERLTGGEDCEPATFIWPAYRKPDDDFLREESIDFATATFGSLEDVGIREELRNSDWGSFVKGLFLSVVTLTRLALMMRVRIN